MPKKELPFPLESYSYDNYWTEAHPTELQDVRTNLHTNKVCLPNEDGDFRRYSPSYDSEFPIRDQDQTIETYTLGAVACPSLLKCEMCPLRK